MRRRRSRGGLPWGWLGRVGWGWRLGLRARAEGSLLTVRVFHVSKVRSHASHPSPSTLSAAERTVDVFPAPAARASQ